MKSLNTGLLCSLVVLFLTGTIFSATFTVTKTTDSNDGTCDSDCSLREAIAAANSATSDDIIDFDGTVFGSAQTVNVTLGEIVIANNGSLTFNGPGATMLTIDGNMNSRIFTITSGAVAAINNATFTNGNGSSTTDNGRAGAIYNTGGTTSINNCILTNNTAVNGGALNNANGGTLTINNSIVSNNVATTSSGGALQNFSSGTLFINNSTFMNNSNSNTTGGGAMQLNGTAFITNSTFSGNNASGGDGGAISSNGSFILITNSTFSGNTAADQGGGIIRRTTNVNMFLRNNIIAGNTSGDGLSPDVFTNSSLTSEGNNIIGEDGPSMGWVASDLLDTDPMLLPLADNGGFGMTFLPNSGSPAIDAGQNCVLDSSCSANNPPFNVTTDQRGVPRPAGTAVDIGSVEVAASSATVTGRVVTSSGRAVPYAIVSIAPAMIKFGSSPQTARTNGFGYFSFSGVQTGQIYTLDASAKEYSFTPQNVQVNGDVSGITLTANGGSSSPGKN